MGVRKIDQRFVEQTRGMVAALAPDIKPQWGKMTLGQMLAHMVTAVRYSLGKDPETPNEGGFFGAHIAAPLILNGYLKIPPGQKGPAMYDVAAPSATLEELAAEFAAFVSAQAKPGFAPPSHPYFGDIGPRGWEKLHVVHMEHHLRQFGIDTRGYVKG